MAVIYDRSARTFIVTLDSEKSVVREHRADQSRIPVITESTERRNLRKAGTEVLGVLRSSQKMMSSAQLHSSLPHVPRPSLRRLISEMAARGDIKRTTYSNFSQQGNVLGYFREFLYGLTTAVST